MYRTKIAAGVISLLAVAACAAETPTGGIAWVKSYSEATTLAKKTGHNLVVDFFTPT
jgi:hypothetical protein